MIRLNYNYTSNAAYISRFWNCRSNSIRCGCNLPYHIIVITFFIACCHIQQSFERASGCICDPQFTSVITAASSRNHKHSTLGKLVLQQQFARIGRRRHTQEHATTSTGSCSTTAFILRQTRTRNTNYFSNHYTALLQANTDNNSITNSKSNRASPTKTMDFLKRIGKIGSTAIGKSGRVTSSGSQHHDLSTMVTTNTIGVDEGNAGSCCSSSTTMVKRNHHVEQQQQQLNHHNGDHSTTATSNNATITASMDHKTTATTTTTIQPTFQSCIETGIIDDMTQPFPYTNSGTKWDVFTDQVMGGISTGNIQRISVPLSGDEKDVGVSANVLSGTVRTENNGGFIQMATNFVPSPLDQYGNSFRTATPVDASQYDGIEFDSYSRETAGSFNVHLKTSNCLRPQTSYRATFQIDTPTSTAHDEPPTWTHVRIPFTQFRGYNVANDVPLDVTKLKRIGIVAIGRVIPHVHLAVTNIKFYNEKK